MPRSPEGQIYVRRTKEDGVYMLRFRAAGYPSEPIELGRLSEGFSIDKARRDRDLVVALIRTGQWKAPQRNSAAPRTPTSLHTACASFLATKRRRGLAPSTLADYTTKIEVHLLPGLGASLSISHIDAAAISAYIANVSAQNARLGDPDNRDVFPRRPATPAELQRWGGNKRRTARLRPISNGEINKHVELLSQILKPYVKSGEVAEDAVDPSEHLLPHTTKKDWKLQPDEIFSLLTASASIDTRPESTKTRRLRGACLRLREQGKTYDQIAAKLGIARSTAYYHASRYGQPPWLQRRCTRH